MPMGILKIGQRIPIRIFLFPILTVADRPSLIPFLDLVLRPLGVFREYYGLERFQNFFCFNALDAVFAVDLNLAINSRPPDVFSCQTFHRELAWVGFM